MSNRVLQVKKIQAETAKKAEELAVARKRGELRVTQDLIDNPPRKKCCACCSHGGKCKGK